MRALLDAAAQTVLDGGITDTASTLDIVSVAGSPAAAPFRIWIDDEILLVTDVTGDTYTVSRGVEGSVAAAHADGEDIFYPLTSGVFVQLAVDIARLTGGGAGGDVDGPASAVDGHLAVFDGTSGKLIKDGGAVPGGGGGTELDYAEITADVTVSGSSGAQTTVIAGNSVSYGGSTVILVEFFAPTTGIGSATLIVELWEDSTSLGRICQVATNVTSNGLYGALRRTPASGSHTYTVKAWKNGGSDHTIAATSPFVPAFLRVTTA